MTVGKLPTGSRAPDEDRQDSDQAKGRTPVPRDERRAHPARSHANPGGTRATIIARRVGTSIHQASTCYSLSRRPAAIICDDRQDPCGILAYPG